MTLITLTNHTNNNNQKPINDNDIINTNLAFEKLGLSSNSTSTSSSSYIKKKRKRTISENTTFDSYILNVSSFSNMTLDDEVNKDSLVISSNDITYNNEIILSDDARSNALTDSICVDFDIDDRYLSSFLTNPIESLLIHNFFDEYQAFINRKLSIFPYFYIKCLQEYTLYRIFKVFFMVNIVNTEENDNKTLLFHDDFHDFVKYFSFLRSYSMNIDEKLGEVNEYSQLCLMIRSKNMNVRWFDSEKVGLLGICYVNLRKRLYENCFNKKKGLFNHYNNDNVLKNEIDSEECLFQKKESKTIEKSFLSHKRNKSNDFVQDEDIDIDIDKDNDKIIDIDNYIY